MIGVGVDTVEISKVKNILLSNAGRHFLSNNFTQKEISYCKSKKNHARHIATTFAGKEAIFKALGTGWTNGKDIEIIRNKNGKPCAYFTGNLKKTHKNKKILLSLSFNNSFAVAFSVIKKEK